jgi:hypothetical protein
MASQQRILVWLGSPDDAEYVRNVANAWADMLQPPGWAPKETEKLRPLLRNDESP